MTVLTNGRRDCLERTLAAFAEHAAPRPGRVFVMDDGGQTGREFVEDLLARLGLAGGYEDSPRPLGMCRAHAHCWHAAAASDFEWVFHIEDDQLVLRPVNLTAIARTLDHVAYLAQVALVRCPWGREVEWGGYIPQSPWHYTRRVEVAVPGLYRGERAEWVETTRNWATSPALFRTSVARRFPWPLDDGCETAIGPQILAARPEAKFGLWGGGEPWYAHIGVERAAGAYGY